MTIRSVDVAILIVYFLATILVGLWVSKRGSKDMDSYFLGGKSLPWYLLGISDASGMFDIAGTMLMVYWLFAYGLKSIWLPFYWPVFNQIFLMMFLSAWLRRANVLTGAEWIQFRFGRGTGANLAHLSVVFFALVNTIGMLAYAFKGIGKFAITMLPATWQITGQSQGVFSDENVFALIILGLTSLYAIKGGMVSVVITEVMQFTILTVTSLLIGIIAISKVSPELIRSSLPEGWINPFFGEKLDLDWYNILDQVNDSLRADGNEWFAIVFGLMFFKGILASLAGPAPNYDMQRVLATRNPREACMMNGMVCCVLYFPRYMMITGIAVLALAFCIPELQAMEKPDFEKLLPIVLTKHVPQGVVGLLLAGLLAAFMSNFAATINAAPAYLVNDIYKRFINPSSTARTDVWLSRAASIAVLIVGILFGLVTDRITDVMMWIVGALYGGYVMANVLKWYWWRFNGYGYFWGMMAGILGAMFVPVQVQGWLDERPAAFTETDIVDLPRLVEKLKSTSATNGASQYVHGLLSPDTKALLLDYRGGSDPVLETRLTQDFNRVIEGEAIFDEKRFEGAMLGRTKDLADMNPRGSELVRLNRMLLESAFSHGLANRFIYSFNPIYTFPILLALSLAGCLLGTYLGKPEDEAILKHFYRTTRPWGCWGPIQKQVMQEDPSFQPNRDCAKDCINVLVGIVWQLCLTALPIFIVLRSWDWGGAVFLVLVITSVFIKFNWYDKLPAAEPM